MQYTRPKLAGRATHELRAEAVKVHLDHADQPFLVRLPSIERHAFITDELARRMREQVRVWQVEEAVAAGNAPAEPEEQLAAWSRGEPD